MALKTDLQLATIGISFMCVLIFHYAWVVKSWLDNPGQEWYEILLKFMLFFANLALLGWLLVKISSWLNGKEKHD